MRKVFRMKDIDCANCAAKMENEIAKLEGVNACSVNFVLQKLTIEADAENMEGIIEKAGAVCKKIDRHAEIIAK